MVHLRELSTSDLEIINSWRNDPELVGQLEAPFRFINQETDNEWFNGYMHSRDKNVRCAICESENQNAIIGSIGLLNIDSISRKADFYLMIGSKEHQGKGIGFQATRLMLNHAFINLNLNRVQLTVLENNSRARHLYEKVGFIFEGIQRQAVYKNGNYIGLVIMGILRSEFCK